ncbi:MAG: PilZ domain-containing protein [Deltaproteobacteria bacterium]|nr:PilZ domain-containing protein [Deltaproteobacteria bacterium]
MPKHYQLVTVDEIQKDEEAILEILSAGRNSIKLLNYYRELPVSFDGSVEFSDRGVVEMNVHDLQAAAMMIEKEVFIKCKGLPYDVVAKVMRIRKNTRSAFLSNFHYVIITAERRVCVRVRLSEKFDAAFHFNDRLIQGQIEDISFSGLSIKVPNDISLEENSSGTVRIALPATTLELSGKLLRVNQDDSSSKFIIELEMDNKSEQCISQFIFSQQSGIIRELKELYSSGPDTIIV